MEEGGDVATSALVEEESVTLMRGCGGSVDVNDDRPRRRRSSYADGGLKRALGRCLEGWLLSRGNDGSREPAAETEDRGGGGVEREAEDMCESEDMVRQHDATGRTEEEDGRRQICRRDVPRRSMVGLFFCILFALFLCRLVLGWRLE